MIVASINAMATIMLSRNTISMILIMTVINGVVVQTMSVTLSIVILTDITMVGVAIRDSRMVVLIDITILVMLLST